MATRVQRLFVVLLAMGLLVVFFWGETPSPTSADEPLTPEFQKAMRLFLRPTPADRARGEKMIISMGDRAVPQLRSWILQGEQEIDRARELLLRMTGKVEGVYEELVAARPFLSSSLARAWSKFHAGQYREAQRMADAVLSLDPDSPDLWQIRRLIRRCQDRLISRELLDPVLEFGQQVCIVDDAPRLHLRLFNRSLTPIYVRADRGILGSIRLIFQRRFLDGSERTDERVQTIRTEEGMEEITIQPGTSYHREMAIFIEEPRPSQGMVMRIRALGKFQPARWEVEGKNITRVMSISPVECWIVAEKETLLAESPIRKLEASLILRDLHSFFTAGSLAVWAGENDPLLRERLIKVLVKSLSELDPVGIRMADALLEKARGKRRKGMNESPDEIADYWIKWWKARSEPARAPDLIPNVLNQ